MAKPDPKGSRSCGSLLPDGALAAVRVYVVGAAAREDLVVPATLAISFCSVVH